MNSPPATKSCAAGKRSIGNKAFVRTICPLGRADAESVWRHPPQNRKTVEEDTLSLQTEVKKRPRSVTKRLKREDVAYGGGGACSAFEHRG